MADNDVIISPQDTGDSVTFVGVTSAPLAGARETEDEPDISTAEYARTLLIKASGPSIDIVLGKAGDAVAAKLIWYEETLAAAFAAARADLGTWAKQRVDVVAQGITYENCIMARPANRTKKKVAGMWGVSYIVLFTAYP